MAQSDFDAAPILVLGANGKTGRRVAERLRTQGLAVRACARSTQPRFDWNDRATWRAALEGVKRAYVTYQPDLAVPGALDTVSAFFDTALASGAERIVLLSGRGEEEAQAAEEALQRSGANWTILRCSWFMQNFSESFLLDPIREGTLALPSAISRSLSSMRKISPTQPLRRSRSRVMKTGSTNSQARARSLSPKRSDVSRRRRGVT